MGSARTVCPQCDSESGVVDLTDLLYSPRMDYFRCRSCGCWWMVPKEEDDAATRIIFGNVSSSANIKKAG